MFHHFLICQKIAKDLDKQLQNATLVACFSQNKDELILEFKQENINSFFIKSDLRPDVGLVSFPETHFRAKKNSVDLFDHLIGLQVQTVDQHILDRSFAIRFVDDYELVFKLYGRRSNIISYHKAQLQNLFRSELGQDLELTLEDFEKSDFLDRNIDDEKIRKIFTHSYHDYSIKNFKNLSLIDVINRWLQLPIYISPIAESPYIGLIQQGEDDLLFENAIEAANSYQQLFVNSTLFEKEKLRLKKNVQQRLKQAQQYIKKSEKKLNELLERRSFREVADILMANLHQIPTGKTEVSLHDFYLNQPICIKLKKDLSPQKNAEVYYRKAKNEKQELDQLEYNLGKKTELVESLNQMISEISEIEDWKSLRAFENFTGPKIKKENNLLPYIRFNYLSYEIWVGKDAKKNDQLTTQYASKEDIWLHAKDVPGSHVLIKNPTKKPVPVNVLEHAAGIAAYYSKRKHDTLCPVLYTPRKYVRKSKKLSAGQVIVEREKVLLVPPQKPTS